MLPFESDRLPTIALFLSISAYTLQAGCYAYTLQAGVHSLLFEYSKLTSFHLSLCRLRFSLKAGYHFNLTSC
ncbi:hypothetical protein DFS34DRAFT_620486 [Phlyctochytrium arcticum]|nr:hypothetical protein DFS34DRAFT_620486 [Phlyctochytrium arcticum]